MNILFIEGTEYANTLVASAQARAATTSRHVIASLLLVRFTGAIDKHHSNINLLAERAEHTRKPQALLSVHHTV